MRTRGLLELRRGSRHRFFGGPAGCFAAGGGVSGGGGGGAAAPLSTHTNTTEASGWPELKVIFATRPYLSHHRSAAACTSPRTSCAGMTPPVELPSISARFHQSTAVNAPALQPASAGAQTSAITRRLRMVNP